MSSVEMAVEIAADPGRVRAELPRSVAVWLRTRGLESRADGEIAVITADEPVQVLSTDDDGGLVTAVDADGATVTTTWTVDGRADRTAVVTSASAGVAAPEAFTERMTTVLVALAAHLEHFPDPPGTELHAWGPSRGRSAASTHEQAHARFLSQVGVIAPRQRFETFRGLPAMAGTCLERRGGHHHSAAALLLDDPMPGVAILATSGTPPVHEVHALLFGDDAVAERLQAQLAAWLAAA
ncbi:hypothetical protein WCD74_26300 [Actinomycetospora sp. OC33-EN08]|uniref:Uncharacterized protein n=1 Tax=Actinomycetospora aurantiaca TaxID=3129233 RepID=A0ABU8MWL7_9PSEU